MMHFLSSSRVSWRALSHSPTMMTWFSYLAKALGFALMSLIIVAKFTPVEVATWYLFLGFLTIQMMFDLGFSPTFIRLLAHADGRRHATTQAATLEKAVPMISIDLQVPEIMRMASIVYIMMALFALVGGGSLGSLMLYKALSQVPYHSIWWAWLFLVFAAAMQLYLMQFSIFLQGLGHLAIAQRNQGIASLGGALASIGVIYSLHSLTLAVIAYQGVYVSCLAINIVYTRRLHWHDWLACWQAQLAWQKNVTQIKAVFAIAWRSGVGILLSSGLVQASGIIYSWFVSPQVLAPYLFALQTIRVISGLSQAPFYSRLPFFAKQFAAHELSSLRCDSQRLLKLSLVIYMLACFVIYLFTKPVLLLVHSQMAAPPIFVWLVLMLAFFFERVGAMHMQLYSLSNHIIWHTVNGLTALLIIILTILMYKLLGEMGFALALLFGYSLFYLWYPTYKAYCLLHEKSKVGLWQPFRFLPPFIIAMLLFTGLMFALAHFLPHWWGG